MTTRTSHTSVDYDPADPRRTAAVFVQAQLDELGLGEHWVQTGEQGSLRVIDRRVPPGHGWCRAVSLYQALWPATADLCVEVDWYPDLDTPADGQDEHWETRLAAVTDRLESLGYIVRMPGPRRTPGVDRYQPMIVSRLPVGASLPPSPADGWDHLPVHPTYKWPDNEDPSRRLRKTLESSQLESYGARTLDTYLWPPYATGAWIITWSGAQTATVDEWGSAMARVRRVLRIAGYGLLDHRRPWDPAVDQGPYVIAYLREASR